MSKIVWIINQNAGKPDSGWGERHYFFSKYWIKKGYKIVIVSGSYNHLFKNQPVTNNENFTYEEVEENILYCWVKIPKYDGGSIFKIWSMIVFSYKVLFLKAKKLETPNVILVSSMPIFPIFTGWMLKGKYKVDKLIFEIRDLWPLTPMYLKGYSKWHPVVIVMGWFEKFGYRKSDYIVSLLPNSENYINSISKSPKKFKWIPNGIEEDLLSNEKVSDTILERIPKDKFIIGYTGTIGMANALEYFIEASKLSVENDKIHFVLVGDGYLKEELVERVNGNSNISFISKIDKNQVQHILSFFDVCFIGRNDTPLFDYGVSSNKYFDYMLSKTPILVSSNKIKDPVEMSEGGIIVTPESGESIVKGIKKLYDMAVEEREKMAEKGYSYVKKYHSFEFLSEKYIDLFDAK